MHLTAPPLRLVGALIVCLVLPASVVVGSGAQTQAPPTETELKAQIAQQPALPAPYLALAKLYVEQGRFEEAERMINNALALTRRQIATSDEEPREPVRSSLSEENPDAVRVGGDIRAPRKLADVKPDYPAEARAAGVSGIVILEVLINEHGVVADAEIVRSVPMLDEAAESAVRQWEFTPTLLNNQPTEVIMTVTVNFTIGS